MPRLEKESKGYDNGWNLILAKYVSRASESA